MSRKDGSVYRVATSVGNLLQCIESSAANFACLGAGMSDIQVAKRIQMSQWSKKCKKAVAFRVM